MTKPPYHCFDLEGCPIFLGDFVDVYAQATAGKTYTHSFAVGDANTLPLLPDDMVSASSLIPAGEQFKTISTCMQVWADMMAAQLDRQSLVLNVGGGVVGDLGGFCAATFKRGLDFMQVPTTLLAMTDASIGGKLGVDFQGIKNSIGVFRQPAAVLIDPDFLKTLPQRELRSGMAEVYKHALIGAPQLWDFLADKKMDDISSWDKAAWLPVLKESINVKVTVVAQDPLEKGLRAVLNFGHTIGHALESWWLNSADPLTHGEAVAIGMLCELAIRDAAKATRLAEVLLGVYPFQRVPEESFPEVWNHMLQDKKNQGGAVRMAIPGEKPFDLQLVTISAQETEAALRWYNSLR